MNINKHHAQLGSYARSPRRFIQRMVENLLSALTLVLFFAVGFALLWFTERDGVRAAIDVGIVSVAPVLANKAAVSGVADAAPAAAFVYLPSQCVNEATEIEDLPARFHATSD